MATLKETLQSLNVTGVLPTSSGNGLNFYAGNQVVGTIITSFEDPFQWVKEHAAWTCSKNNNFMTVNKPREVISLAGLFDEPKKSSRKVKA